MGRHEAIHARPEYWHLPTWAAHIFDRLERLETVTASVSQAWADLDTEISAVIALAQQAAQASGDAQLIAEIEQRATTLRNAHDTATAASSATGDATEVPSAADNAPVTDTGDVAPGTTPDATADGSTPPA